MFARPLTWIIMLVMSGSLFAGVFYFLAHSEAYQLSASRLAASSEAAEALGTPISTGLPSGEIAVNNQSGTAVINFSATGPKATGRLFAEAFKAAGVWQLKSLMLKVDGRDTVIDLLKPSNVERETRR